MRSKKSYYYIACSVDFYYTELNNKRKICATHVDQTFVIDIDCYFVVDHSCNLRFSENIFLNKQFFVFFHHIHLMVAAETKDNSTRIAFDTQNPLKITV